MLFTVTNIVLVNKFVLITLVDTWQYGSVIGEDSYLTEEVCVGIKYSPRWIKATQKFTNYTFTKY